MTVATATDPKLCDGLADSFASGEGLEDALFMNPTMLFQVDEMDTLLNSMKTKDSRAEGLIEKMLRIFTASAAAYRRGRSPKRSHSTSVPGGRDSHGASVFSADAGTQGSPRS